MSDEQAKDATTLTQEGWGISFKSASATINRLIKDPPTAEWKHERSAAVYSEYSEAREKAVVGRADEKLLACLRSGKHLGFGAYRFKIGKAKDASCDRCGAAIDDLGHWLMECPGTMAARIRIFGTTDVGYAILTRDPTGAVQLPQSTLRLSWD